jgi:hypothetical protein
VHDKKWETDETRYAQTTSVSDPFSVTHKMPRPERINFNSSGNVKATPIPKSSHPNFSGQVLFNIGESGCRWFGLCL